LTQQQAGHWVWRLSAADASGQAVWRDSGGCQSVVADHALLVKNDHDGGETFRLIAQSPVFEPMVKGWFAALKVGNMMWCRQCCGCSEHLALWLSVSPCCCLIHIPGCWAFEYADQLRQELSDHIVDGPQDRYRLNWPEKREALTVANALIAE